MGLKLILTKGEEWMEINKITAKELQRTLKVANKKISIQDFNVRLGTIDYKMENISKFRHQCKNVKLRHIYFRLISKDFFTMEKMFKYKTFDNNKCKRCGEIETYKHLLWECGQSRRIWNAYNEFLGMVEHPNEAVVKYDDVFIIGNRADLSKIKVKIIQGMIQIERPSNWTIENLNKIANETKNMELYNSYQGKEGKKKLKAKHNEGNE
jgi:hypothetical protein